MPDLSVPNAGPSAATGTHRWSAYVSIARPDHWFKNVFVLPGIVVGAGSVPGVEPLELAWRVGLGLVSICLVASSYYTLNELLDAPFDRFHPTKHARPVPAGQVRIGVAYGQFVLLALAGLGMALAVSTDLAATMAALWLMACAYNVRPLRTKDRPYLDVLTEAVNNPLRMTAGWFMVTAQTLPPASLLLAYWMIGAYFMALKRLAEYRQIADAPRAARYRRSFAHYTNDRLLVSVMFYAAASMLFFGAFCMRYRLELLLAFPLVAYVMAQYLYVALKPDSAAQHPERLYRERGLMLAVVACAVLMTGLLARDLPWLHKAVIPTAPPQAQVLR